MVFFSWLPSACCCIFSCITQQYDCISHNAKLQAVSTYMLLEILNHPCLIPRIHHENEQFKLSNLKKVTRLFSPSLNLVTILILEATTLSSRVVRGSRYGLGLIYCFQNWWSWYKNHMTIDLNHGVAILILLHSNSL